IRDLIVTGVQTCALPILPSVESWLEFYFMKNFPFCPWAEHVDGYWRIRNRPNVLFLTFEELKRNLPEAVSRIAALLRIDLTPDRSEERRVGKECSDRRSE